MNNQRFALAAMAFAGLCLATAGCILGDDPNKNSQIFGIGGTTGSADGGGQGGAGGGGGGPGTIVGSAIDLFDTGLEGFAISTYADKLQINLNDPSNPVNTGKPAPVLTFDSAVGNPDPGSISFMVPYSGANQYGEILKTFPATSPQNWKNKTLHARVRATSGSFKGGVQLYVKTGTAFAYGSFYTPFTATTGWQEITFNLSSGVMNMAAGFDAAQVVEFGAQINSSSTGTAQGPVTFNIDSFSVDPPIVVPDAGPETSSPDADTTDTAGSSDASGN
jgi:hypothetical protein